MTFHQFMTFDYINPKTKVTLLENLHIGKLQVTLYECFALNGLFCRVLTGHYILTRMLYLSSEN